MQDDVAIKVDHVSKMFKLPHEKQTSVKSALINIFKGGKRSYEKQEVLKDASFEIKKGEFFGIVGRNGSGKSTLLKMLAGIYTPSDGNIYINGKLTPFIELGVGFNPELTGRENVFLNGALLGFNRKEMSVMYDDIVDFAELERFMDQKLKNYSSGMQVRLAFSIAIRAQTPILLLDEVLAVGDEAFQQKCMNVFEEYKAKGRTVVLVSHDMGMVSRFCTRAMLVHEGKVVMVGDPTTVALKYTSLNDEKIDKELARKNKDTETQQQVKVKLKQPPLGCYDDELAVSIEWSGIKQKVSNVGVAIFKTSGEYVFGTNTIIENISIGTKPHITYRFRATVGNGSYQVKVGLFGKTSEELLLFVEKGPEFVIKDDKILWQGITHLNHKWEKE